MKICNKGKSGRKDSWITGWQKRGCIFSAKDVAKNVQEKSNEERRAKRVNCKIKMPIIYVRGNCFETPLYVHVLCNKRTIIRTNCEKGEELKRGRGIYEARRVKGTVSIITSNLAASATHHLVSVVPRIQIAVSKKIPFFIRVENLCALSYSWRKMEQPYSPNLSDLAECVILCTSWLQSPGKVFWICDLRTTLCSNPGMVILCCTSLLGTVLKSCTAEIIYTWHQ